MFKSTGEHHYIAVRMISVTNHLQNHVVLLLMVLLITIGNADASDVMLSTPQRTGYTGETLILPVHLEHTTHPVATLVLNLYFDVTKVELVDISFAAVLSELGKQTYHRVQDSRAVIVLTLGEPIVNPGELFYLHFRLSNYLEQDSIVWMYSYEASAATQDATRLEVSYTPENILLFDQDFIYHSADINRDRNISLTEILHVIQLYNAGAYHCDALTSEYYAPGMGEVENEICNRHDSDYLEPAWKIGLRELLHLIQLYNAAGYQHDPESQEQFNPMTQKSINNAN